MKVITYDVDAEPLNFDEKATPPLLVGNPETDPMVAVSIGPLVFVFKRSEKHVFGQPLAFQTVWSTGAPSLGLVATSMQIDEGWIAQARAAAAEELRRELRKRKMIEEEENVRCPECGRLLALRTTDGRAIPPEDVACLEEGHAVNLKEGGQLLCRHDGKVQVVAPDGSRKELGKLKPLDLVEDRSEATRKEDGDL